MIKREYYYVNWELIVARIVAAYFLVWLPITLYITALFVLREGSESFTSSIVKQGLTPGQGFGHWFLQVAEITAWSMLFWGLVFLAYSLYDRWERLLTRAMG